MVKFNYCDLQFTTDSNRPFHEVYEIDEINIVNILTVPSRHKADLNVHSLSRKFCCSKDPCKDICKILCMKTYR